MPWMSITAFKQRSRSSGKSRVKYERVHSVKVGKWELVVEMKKRYLRFFSHPEDVIVPICRVKAKALVKALEKRIGFTFSEKESVKVSKDERGMKTYGKVKDAFGLDVVVRELDMNHVGILAENMMIPHLRDAEVEQLGLALKRFVSEE